MAVVGGQVGQLAEQTSFARQLGAVGAVVLVAVRGGVLAVVADADRLSVHTWIATDARCIAANGDRVLIGTSEAVLEYGDVGADRGSLRSARPTGDLGAEGVAIGGDGRAWLVSQRRSCVAAAGVDERFAPAWRPPVAYGRRLNGLALVGGEPRFVTALDGGGRGSVLEVPSGEIVAAALHEPSAPRWHDGRLWLLQAGSSTLAVVDPATGATSAVAALPGTPRGLALVGDRAFIGIAATPATCAVCVVDRRNGHAIASVDLENELIDVAVLDLAGRSTV